MPQRKRLTPKFIDSLEAAPKGGRYEVMDDIVAQFGVRVTDKGAKSWFVYRRWGDSPKPARRTIASTQKMDLAEARDKARNWLKLAEEGTDYKEEARKEAERRIRLKSHTFGSAAEGWFDHIEKTDRSHAATKADVTREFLPLWKDRPIAGITEDEIKDLIKNKAKKTPAQARNLLTHLTRMFPWAYEQPERYGLSKPLATSDLNADALTGPKEERDRVLSDEELRKVWQVVAAMPYPFGPFVKALALTGQRLREVAGARWSEFDLKNKVWIIPASRMKKTKKPKPHAVPIGDDFLALLKGLPRFNRGDCLFSTTSGKKPITGFSKAKGRIDDLVGEIPHWTFHDVRRTMRTNLSPIKQIDFLVKEMMIAHQPKTKTQRTYDLHPYLDERREGFTLWESKLRAIVAAPT